MSDSERREIAARLRDFDSLRPAFEESAICGFLDVLDIGYLDWEGICGRLAELIEPEPERTVVLGGSGRCPDCKKLIGTGERYCAWCGARIVEE